MTLFEKLDQSPDGEKTRRLITASGQYGITKGAYNAEFLELTQDEATVTSDESTAANRLQARFDHQTAIFGSHPSPSPWEARYVEV